MPRGDAQAQNHPKRGSSILVEPIKDRAAINAIKARLKARSPRDYCLFTLGINTAYRAGELLSLTIGQVAHLSTGDLLGLRQSKSGKYRSVTLNGAATEALQGWLCDHPVRGDLQAPLFLSRRSDSALSVSAVNRLVKGWCAEEGLKGNYGPHSLRKTWGYHQRLGNEAPIPLLMIAFGHKTQAQTLLYLHIQESEVAELYTGMEL